MKLCEKRKKKKGRNKVIKLFKNKKRKAIAFVDYEYWFYSCKEKFSIAPNIQKWKKEIEEKYDVKDIMIFGDFSHENITGELPKIRRITNTIIETGNTFAKRKKDMTDFVMLDYIYQATENHKDVDTYILFTGDGHFQSVVKYLSNKKGKDVVVYGLPDSFSKQLQDVATDAILVDLDGDIQERNCRMILNNMAIIEDKSDIMANFLQAVETVSKASNIPEEEFGNMLVKALKQCCGEF